MKFTIKVPAVGTFHGIFPSAQAARTWADDCYPLAWPATVICKAVQ